MMRCCIFAAMAVTAGLAFADRLTLKSGSVLTGTAGTAANGALKFKSDDLGEIEVKLEKIEKLENAGTHVVKYADGREETLKLAVEKGAYLANAKPLDMAAVKAIDPVAEKWHGSVAVAFQAARGNTYETAGSLVANVNRRWEKDRLTGDFGYYYGETGKADADNQKTTDRWEIELKHDHFWLPQVYHYEDVRYDRDRIALLNARYRAGLGGGYQWLEKSACDWSGIWSFNQELGLNWIKEEYEDNDDDKAGGYCALRYAHHLNWVPVWAPKVDVFHNAEILPEVDEWDKFIAKADIGFSTKIVYDWALTVKIEWDFDSKPANDRKRDDLRYIVGLGYKW